MKDFFEIEMKSFIITVISLILIGGMTRAIAQDWTTRMTLDKNVAYGELGGKGLIYGVYYERLITPNVGISVGATYWPEFFSIPLFVSWYPIGGVHSPYLDVGIALRGVEEYFIYSGGYYGFYNDRKYSTYTPAVLGVGYCFRSSADGVYFRIGAMMFVGKIARDQFTDDIYRFRHWFGIGYGYTF